MFSNFQLSSCPRQVAESSFKRIPPGQTGKKVSRMKIVGKKFPYNIQHVTVLSSFSTFTFFTFASLIQPRYDCAVSRQPFHADLLSSAVTCFFNVPAILPLGPPVPFLLSFPLFILSLSLRLDRFDGPVHGNPESYLRAR